MSINDAISRFRFTRHPSSRRPFDLLIRILSMEESFWEHFCYYFALDYEYLTQLCHTYLSLRGLVGRFPKSWAVPDTPRVRVAVPLLTVDGDIQSTVGCHDYESADGISDDDDDDEEVDVHFEGSLGSSVSSSSCLPPHEYSIVRLPGSLAPSALARRTPDIVRTVPAKDRSREQRQHQFGGGGGQFLMSTSSSYQSLLDHDLDRGFCSDTSTAPSIASPRQFGPSIRDLPPMGNRPTDTDTDCQTTEWRSGIDRLAELQQQLRRVQHDMAQLVEWRHSLSCPSAAVAMTTSNSLQFSFRPAAASSPARPQTAISMTPHDSTGPVAPPPPCGPPSPPPVSTGTKVILASKLKKRTPMRNMPDMSEVLKQLGSVVLRPVLPRTTGSGNNVDDSDRPLTFGPRVPLRSVSKNESIIACALRERFKNVRMLPDEDEDDSSETEHPDGCLNGHSSMSDEWTDNSIGQSRVLPTVDWTATHSLAGRSLLRKVDRSQLPAVVTRDLPDDGTSPQL